MVDIIEKIKVIIMTTLLADEETERQAVDKA